MTGYLKDLFVKIEMIPSSHGYPKSRKHCVRQGRVAQRSVHLDP